METINTAATDQTVAPASTNPAAGSQRIVAIDALRGFDMFWILGGEGLFHALDRMDGGPVTSALAAQFTHKEWAGFAFYDLIFPLFVFIVGVSIVFSLTKSVQKDGLPATHNKIARR